MKVHKLSITSSRAASLLGSGFGTPEAAMALCMAKLLPGVEPPPFIANPATDWGNQNESKALEHLQVIAHAKDKTAVGKLVETTIIAPHDKWSSVVREDPDGVRHVSIPDGYMIKKITRLDDNGAPTDNISYLWFCLEIKCPIKNKSTITSLADRLYEIPQVLHQLYVCEKSLSPPEELPAFLHSLPCAGVIHFCYSPEATVPMHYTAVAPKFNKYAAEWLDFTTNQIPHLARIFHEMKNMIDSDITKAADWANRKLYPENYKMVAPEGITTANHGADEISSTEI